MSDWQKWNVCDNVFESFELTFIAPKQSKNRNYDCVKFRDLPRAWLGLGVRYPFLSITIRVEYELTV